MNLTTTAVYLRMSGQEAKGILREGVDMRILRSSICGIYELYSDISLDWRYVRTSDINKLYAMLKSPVNRIKIKDSKK
jgi:hypothetical protein